jgi:tRNA threonylcarbamoyl adenosine modification protein (Sua5/YciO/YrdC/YwlC family)
MQVLTKTEVDRKQEVLLKKLRDGAVFVYPTDTIYGIGCHANHDQAVRKVRDIKQRPDKPFSVIAPSKQWIYQNFEIDEKAESWISRLPGPYTLILRPKSKDIVASSVHPDNNTLAVRMPDHWIHGFVRALGEPVITPSANISGQEPMTSVENIDPAIKSKIDFIFDDGEKKGRPSKLVDLTGEEEKVIVR